MVPESSGERGASCICHTAGLRSTRTPTLNGEAASPPDAVHLFQRKSPHAHILGALFLYLDVCLLKSVHVQLRSLPVCSLQGKSQLMTLTFHFLKFTKRANVMFKTS